MNFSPGRLDLLPSYKSGFRSRIRGRAGSRIRAEFGIMMRLGSRSTIHAWSKIENIHFVIFGMRSLDIEIMDISELIPRLFISKQQRRLGILLNGNRPEKNKKFGKNLLKFLKFIDPKIPILVLKELKVALGNLKRKMNFCLIGEEFWMVF